MNKAKPYYGIVISPSLTDAQYILVSVRNLREYRVSEVDNILDILQSKMEAEVTARAYASQFRNAIYCK